jgi:RNA polymerase sigma factor (sigma-70 family)
MAGGHIGSALRRLRGLLGAQGAGGPTDGDLLRRYVAQGDEAAFEALLRRHGPMVLGLCRRLLGTAQDVDDAFQATFLVLIRKAASIGDGERIGNWLYGVAYRVAVRARARAARDRARQKPLTDVVGGGDAGDAVPRDVLALLDEEVSRLPARYREAVVCCYLEGRTQEEAAHVLGWPKGTVSTRLNRARELLRARLTRRGLTVTAGSVILLFGQATAEGALPPRLIQAVLSTLRQALVDGPLPAGAAALADAVVGGAFAGRVRDGVAVVLALAAVTVGHVVTSGLGRQAPPRDSGPALAQVRPSYTAGGQRPAPSPGANSSPGAVLAHGPAESPRPRPAAGARPAGAKAGGETEVQVLTLTITRSKGPAHPRSSGDLAKDHVHTSLKVTAGQGWQVARLPSGRTLVAANGTDGQVIALIFLSDGFTACDQGAPPRTAEFPRGKVWRCWQVSPSGTWSEVEVLHEEPHA